MLVYILFSNSKADRDKKNKLKRRRIYKWTYLEGRNFRGRCLNKSQKEAIGAKIYKKCRIFAFELLI